MISGTAKETAALAISKVMTNANMRMSPNVREFLMKKERGLKLAERRELVRAGKLPASSALPFVVALDVDHVQVVEVWCSAKCGISLCNALGEAIIDTTLGTMSLWFDAEGNAFISFEDEQDSTLFRLALEARS